MFNIKIKLNLKNQKDEIFIGVENWWIDKIGNGYQNIYMHPI